MKKVTSLWLATALLVGTVGTGCAVSDRDRDDRRVDRSDRRDSRSDNWWDRLTGSRGDSRDLEGRWYRNGDPEQRTQIVATRDGLEAIGEKGNKSRLEVDRNGDVRALDWGRGGLRGDVRRDRIEWEDGSNWTREPSRRVGDRR